MTNGFAAYKTYLAMRLHFTQQSYSFIKYNGNVRASETTFRNKGAKQKWVFEKLERLYPSKEHPAYFAANFAHNNIKYPGDIIKQECIDQYSKYKKYHQAWQHFLTEYLSENEITASDLQNRVKVRGDYAPDLFLDYMDGSIDLDTIMLLDKAIGFTLRWWHFGPKAIQHTLMPMIKYKMILPEKKRDVQQVLREYFKQHGEE